MTEARFVLKRPDTPLHVRWTHALCTWVFVARHPGLSCRSSCHLMRRLFRASSHDSMALSWSAAVRCMSSVTCEYRLIVMAISACPLEVLAAHPFHRLVHHSSPFGLSMTTGPVWEDSGFVRTNDVRWSLHVNSLVGRFARLPASAKVPTCRFHARGIPARHCIVPEGCIRRWCRCGSVTDAIM